MTEYELQARYDSRKSFYGKAMVVEDGNTITLYSYKSKVVEIKTNGTDDYEVKIFPVYQWDSNTTLRHIKEFLKQNGLEASSKDQIMRDYEFER